MINPVATNLTRKMQGGISKNDKLDTLTICDVLASNQRVKSYRISKYSSFDLYEQKLLTREHHNLKEEENQLLNRLQKCIDVVFPEFNSLFKSKYGIVYMNILKEFGSADAIAHADIRTLRKCFDTGRGKHISLTAQELKEAARNSIGFPSSSEATQIKHLVARIELIQGTDPSEVDKMKSSHPKQLLFSHSRISHFSEYFNSLKFRRYTQLLNLLRSLNLQV